MALLLLTKARKFLLHEALDQTVAESESRGGEHVADGWVDAGVVLVEAEPRGLGLVRRVELSVVCFMHGAATFCQCPSHF